MVTFQNEGSPWRLRSIIRLELHTVSYKPLRGETWIPLPKELADKKAIINMQNKDNKCFLWCVLRALNPRKNNPQRLDKELMVGWLVVLGFNATLTAKVISWRSVTHMCFLAFSHQY